MAGVGFFLSLRAPTNPLQLHLRSTLPMIIAVGLLATGYGLLRAPREIEVGADGLRVRSRRAERHLPWGDIAWADTPTQAITNRKMLSVYGNNGKVILKVDSNLERFDALVSAVTQRLTDHPSPHAAAVRWRKSRRQGTGLLVGAVLACAGAAFIVWMTYDQHRTETLLRTRGVAGEGVVVRKFIAPDGRTHRIEYRGAGAGANATLHNVEIDPLIWNALASGAHLPITTVPGHPDIARLSAAEIADSYLNPSIGLNIFLFVAMIVMAAAFLVGSILGFKGIDIRLDKTAGKLKVERLPPLV